MFLGLVYLPYAASCCAMIDAVTSECFGWFSSSGSLLFISFGLYGLSTFLPSASSITLPPAKEKQWVNNEKLRRKLCSHRLRILTWFMEGIRFSWATFRTFDPFLVFSAAVGRSFAIYEGLILATMIVSIILRILISALLKTATHY